MSRPADVAAKMDETRRYLKELWGEDRYRKTIDPLIAAVRRVGEKTDRSAFQVAIDEAKRAGAEGKEGIVWQFTAAACDIAEGSP